MNLDIGSGRHSLQTFWIRDALHCDVVKAKHIEIVCDIQHLPFNPEKTGHSFKKTFAFHVLEHVDDPLKALKECIRVTSEMIELETPHRFSLNVAQKGHVHSFRPSWFHKVLKNFRHHLENRVLFPGYIYIHVWIWL